MTKYIPTRGRGTKAVIGAMGKGAKGAIVMKGGRVVASAYDAADDDADTCGSCGERIDDCNDMQDNYGNK
jgi:hypothetical protein